MSYILDALRRADAERERGSVPTLHAQPATPRDAPDAEETPRPAPPWLWVALGLLLAAVLALAWKLLAPDAPHDAAGPRSIGAANPTAVAGGASAAVQAPPTPPAPPPAIPTQFPTQALSEIKPVPPPRPAPSKDVRPPPMDTRPDTPVATAMPSPTTTGPAPRAAAGTAASGAAEERVYALAELPDDIRRGLPALPISGSTYSQNPASRMLIINGQVFHEGDSITPELKLEQIRLKGAVLRYRNYRYAISF